MSMVSVAGLVGEGREALETEPPSGQAGCGLGCGDSEERAGLGSTAGDG